MKKNAVLSPINSSLQPSINVDRWRHAQLAYLTGGISAASLHMAFEDWLLHLALSLAEQVAMLQKGMQIFQQMPSYAMQAVGSKTRPSINAPQDRRFAAPDWQTWPFNVISESFLFTQQWWQDLVAGVRGVSQHHEEVVSFAFRQMLDAVSPANFLWTNPEVLNQTAKTGGANLWQGFQNLMEDLRRLRDKAPPLEIEGFQVGKSVAITPGQVVFRNHLIELIQYEPAGPKVYPEPILIVPAWIMKYYILDLSPDNSLIKYLVDQGHTVFAVSWTNPTAADRDLSMVDYLRLGVMAAIDTVSKIIPGPKIHAVGYCLGGTLLTIAAAAMKRDADDRLATLSLLAAQTDFTEPGKLGLFIDDSQISALEDMMWDRGYLDSQQMAGAFVMINANELLWSNMQKDYLMGKRTPMSDLMAWNADGTRLPYSMHTEYLRRLYLHNDLASGRFPVNGKPIALTDIECPVFCIGTMQDHVAPWRSVYKLHLLTDVEITFLLTSGGHNGGIVNPPGLPNRSYQVLQRPRDGQYLEPDAWLEAAPHHEGSWWPNWQDWLKAHSGAAVAAPGMGAKDFTPLVPAPGSYVLQK